MPNIPNPQSEFLREPNLLIPGKKPVGAVKIDWGHPLTGGLTGAYVFNAGSHVFYDLTKSGGVTAAHSSMPIAGEGLDLTNPTNVTDLPVPDGFAGSDNWTIFFRGRHITGTSAASECLLAIRDGTLAAKSLIFYPWDSVTGDGIRIYMNGGNRVDQNSGAVHFDTNPHNFTFAHDSAVGKSMWIDNEADISGSYTTNLFSSIDNLSIGGWYTTIQLINNAWLHALFFWGNKTLSEDEKTSLHNDPYQFLIPS